MRKVKRAALLFSALGAVLIISGVVYARLFPLPPVNGSYVEETLYFSNVRELVVISGTLPIKLERSENEVCEVSYMSDLPLISEIDEYGTLRLTQDDSFSLSLLSGKRKDFHLTVKLPEKNYRRVSLASSSGDISCAGISCDSLGVSTRSGAVSLSEADHRTEIRTESGEVNVGITSIDGDMSISAGSGSVHLAIPARLSFFLKFLTDGGKLTLDGEEYRRGDAALLINGGGSTLTVTTSAGDLTINKE